MGHVLRSRINLFARRKKYFRGAIILRGHRCGYRTYGLFLRTKDFWKSTCRQDFGSCCCSVSFFRYLVGSIAQGWPNYLPPGVVNNNAFAAAGKVGFCCPCAFVSLLGRNSDTTILYLLYGGGCCCR